MPVMVSVILGSLGLAALFVALFHMAPHPTRFTTYRKGLLGVAALFVTVTEGALVALAFGAVP